MNRKKILLIAPPESEHTLRWIKMIQGFSEFEIYYISFRKEWTPVPNSSYIPIYSFIPYKLNLIIAWIKIQTLVKKINPDIIHAHYLHPFGLFTLGINKPVIISFWGSDITQSYKKSNGIMRMLFNSVINSASHIFTVGEHLTDMIDEKPKKKDILIWGIDTLNIGVREKSHIEEFGIHAEERVILSIRIMREIFQIERIIESFKIVSKRFKDMRLILIKGPYETYNRKIANLIEGNKQITVLPMMANDQYLKLVRNSDIGISIATKDGSPVSVKECMGVGVPVIYQDIEALKPLLENNKTGIALKTKTVEELTDKLTRLCSDSELYNNISSSARKFAFEYLDQEAQSRKALKKYREIIR